jgi:hypothetical protein
VLGGIFDHKTSVCTRRDVTSESHESCRGVVRGERRERGRGTFI